MDEKKSQARSALSSGASLLKMGDVVQALGYLQRAVELDPHSLKRGTSWAAVTYSWRTRSGLKLR